MSASFSTRSEQIKQKVNEVGSSSAKSKEIAALSTRKAKEIKNPEQLKNEWRERSRELGITEESLKSDLYKTPLLCRKRTYIK